MTRKEMFHYQIVLVTITLIVVNFVDGSALGVGSNGNQYRWRESEKEQPPNGIARSERQEATDTKNPPSQDKLKDERKLNEHRNKRSYYPYSPFTYQLPQFPSISVWRPQVYPLQRPYFVPIYGMNGRVPIYVPQQPFYINPIIPTKPPYVGPTYLPPIKPTYLPPVTPPTVNETMTTMMPTDNRFGGEDDDDRPIWDNENNETTQRPTMVPTRKPASTSESKTFPPLVHKDGNNSPKAPNNINTLSSNEAGKPVTASPPSPSLNKPPPGPSRCVWAIISCCSTASNEVSYNCFEQFGCSGPFWDASPCETEYAKAAIQSALNYYNSRS